MAAAGIPVEDESELVHKHHKNYEALRNVAQSGCRICIVILGNYQLQMCSVTRHFKRPIRYVINTNGMDEGQEWRRLDFDSLISGIDTVSIPESLGIDSYRYRIDSS
jgi:hypothetical protein